VKGLRFVVSRWAMPSKPKPNRNDADAFAESLRPIVAPFIHLSSRRIAKVLNDRGIKSPTGKAWQSVAVLRLVERLKGETHRSD